MTRGDNSRYRHCPHGLRGFFWPRVPYADDGEREEFAAKIRAALDADR